MEPWAGAIGALQGRSLVWNLSTLAQGLELFDELYRGKLSGPGNAQWSNQAAYQLKRVLTR
eukprot:9063175-Lingulodinium_polyedra.AAC.1